MRWRRSGAFAMMGRVGVRRSGLCLITLPAVYSEIDVGLLLYCSEPPVAMAEAIGEAKDLDARCEKKLSVFWGNSDYTWGRIPVDSNDRAVEYLYRVRPTDLNLEPIDLALACRQEKSTADDVFALAPDLNRQFGAAFSYISGKSQR